MLTLLLVIFMNTTGNRNEGCFCASFYDTEDRSFLLGDKGEVLPDKVEFNRENHFSRYAKLYA